jgi:hypothetical protein
MVICAVFGCSNNSSRTTGVSFYRLPSVVTHQGDKARELSQKRRNTWLARIRRADLVPEKYANTRVCSRHFVTGNNL